MKKLLTAIALSTCFATANATGMPIHQHYPNPMPQSEYEHGKRDAYNNVARTVVIAGVAIIAGVVIYHLGKESRWTTNENGIAYRF